MEVSERTIYRDVDELSLCGVPIEGEPGRGYRLPKGFEIPPYATEDGKLTARTVRPLGLYFWGKLWTLAAR